ncbi:hypothetical protein D3C85_1376840 [compost metagenome]
MQHYRNQGDDKAEQNGGVTANFRHGRQKCQGLQDDSEHQQGADQILQLLTNAFVPVRNHRREGQVEQAEERQVQRVRLLQVGYGFGSQARDKGQQQGCCAR